MLNIMNENKVKKTKRGLQKVAFEHGPLKEE